MIGPLVPGARLGLVGASGSGKTQFFRWLVGLEIREGWTPFEEEEWALPKTRGEWVLWRQKLQWVPQRVALAPLSVREFLEEPREFGAPGLSEPMKELDRLGFTDPARILSSPLARLSGGELSRVAFLRALASGPEFLLLDETTAALDPGLTLRFEERLEDWMKEAPAKRGFWLCSHQATQTERLGLTVWRMGADGKLLGSDSKDR
jgi:ABC-type glutathione transport system ATPase component